MRRIVRVAMIGAGVAASVAVAATASAPAAVTLGPGPAVCEPFQAHTLASSRTAVVYSLNGLAYACLRPVGPTYKLGSATICNGTTHAGPFALAGDDLAYGAETGGVDDSSTRVIVRSLKTGRVLRREPATSRTLVEQEGGIRSLVLKGDGSVAWIAVEQSLGNKRRLLQVREDDRGGDTLLSSSLAVLPSSLKLHGSRLTWRDAGTLRSATLG